MMANASTVFHAGGRTVASIGNRSRAGRRGRRVFPACASQQASAGPGNSRLVRSALSTAISPRSRTSGTVVPCFRTVERYGRTCPKSPPHAAGEISPFHPRGDTVAVEDDPLAEAMRFLLDAQGVLEVSL